MEDEELYAHTRTNTPATNITIPAILFVDIWPPHRRHNRDYLTLVWTKKGHLATFEMLEPTTPMQCLRLHLT